MPMLSRGLEEKESAVEDMSLAEIVDELQWNVPATRRNELNGRLTTLLKSIGSTNVNADLIAAQNGVAIIDDASNRPTTYTGRYGRSSGSIAASDVPIDLSIATLKRLAADGMIAAWQRLAELAQANDVWDYISSNIRKNFDSMTQEGDVTEKAVLLMLRWRAIVSTLAAAEQGGAVPKDITNLLDEYTVALYKRLGERLRQLDSQLKTEPTIVSKSSTPDAVEKVLQLQAAHNELNYLYGTLNSVFLQRLKPGTTVDQTDLAVGAQLTNVGDKVRALAQEVAKRPDTTVDQLKQMLLFEEATAKATAEKEVPANATGKSTSAPPLQTEMSSDSAATTVDQSDMWSAWMIALVAVLGAFVLLSIVLIIAVVVRSRSRQRKPAATATPSEQTDIL